ncbi:MAG: carboxypeptidase-like regulatory domain-containing protein [Isosphaeraceae bacterium]
MACFNTWDIGACGCGPPACQICVSATTCQGSLIGGATITLTQSGTTIGTGTTASVTGGYCFTGLAAGSYNVAVTKTGYTGSNQNVTLSCPGTQNVVLWLTTTSAPTVSFTVTGCGGQNLPGATVTIGGGTYTTNSSGVAGPIALGNGTYPVSISKSPRWQTLTPSNVVVSGCVASGGGTFALTPASGYVCCLPASGGSICADPIATTLLFTGPAGNALLTYQASPGCTYGGCGFASGATMITGSPCDVSSGSAGFGVNWDPSGGVGAFGFSYTYGYGLHSGTHGFTWTNLISCEFGTWTGPCTVFINFGPVSSSTIVCPPAFQVSGTVAGVTGLGAIFNGAWTITE